MARAKLKYRSRAERQKAVQQATEQRDRAIQRARELGSRNREMQVKQAYANRISAITTAGTNG